MSHGRGGVIREREAASPDYGVVAKALHWLIVILLIVQYTVAWTMPEIHRGTQPETLINLHMSLGITVLVAALIRLIWRLIRPVPLINDNVPLWRQWAARGSHGLMYLILFALPLLGWVAASGRDWAIDFWGANLPRLIAAAPQLAGAIGDYHTLLSYILLGIIGLHLLAALYHHFWLQDRVLLRMLPGRSELGR